VSVFSSGEEKHAKTNVCLVDDDTQMSSYIQEDKQHIDERSNPERKLVDHLRMNVHFPKLHLCGRTKKLEVTRLRVLLFISMLPDFRDWFNTTMKG